MDGVTTVMRSLSAILTYETESATWSSSSSSFDDSWNSSSSFDDSWN